MTTTIFPNGIFLESHGSKLNYVTNYSSSYGYLWGFLGNTQCCGSACVLITEITDKLFLHILKETKTSVLHIVETGFYGEVLPYCLPSINASLKGCATVTVHKVGTNQWLALVEITDQVEYERKFL